LVKKSSFWLQIILAGILVFLTGCKSSGAAGNRIKQLDYSTIGGPVTLRGEMEYSNEFAVETYYVEQAVALNDLTGFVLRDEEWELPVDSQVLGYLEVDEEANRGKYQLQLPVQPAGVFNDVDQNGAENKGVQIFTVAYSPNLAGGPFSVGDDRSRGWPSYLASIKTDRENQDEIKGGRILVWAPDDQQQFPQNFGADGMLFTKDDPVQSLPAGYSVIDLDRKPFAILRDAEIELQLYEPDDVAVKDFSKNSYSQAFQKLFDTLTKEYAFNGIKGKQPDWEALYDEVMPQVKAAEKQKDARAYYLALLQFALGFQDGHVSMNGDVIGGQYYYEQVSSGYGFGIRELDDGRVLVVHVTKEGPAAEADIQVGAEILKFNGQPIADAIASVEPISGPFSTQIARRLEQARFLLRAPVGTEATVTYKNPGQAEKTVTLAAVLELDSFNATSPYTGRESSVLPLDYKYLTSGVGYIRINSNYDDLNLLYRLFERAIKEFEKNRVPGIIIDMRVNSGGASLGLAGFLTDQEIPMGQLEYFSDKTGKFEPEGVPDRVIPNESQYHFDKMALLVDQTCYSACELEAYGFSQVPGMIVVGQYPTAGVEAETARGKFDLPEGFTFTAPTGRFVLPEGEIFLEGQGVPPTLKVAIDETSVLDGQDTVLAAAEQAVLRPSGAGITPDAPPELGTPAEAERALQSGASWLSDAARNPLQTILPVIGTADLTVTLSESQPLIWAQIWCAADQTALAASVKKLDIEFRLNGETIPLSRFAQSQGTLSGRECYLVYTVLDDWQQGEHQVETRVTLPEAMSDGFNEYDAGEYVIRYQVFVAK
jgi:C-terminal processing protease CtpA/Prc